MAHSLSPALHRAGFSAAGLTGWSYEAIDCDADRLAGLVGALGPEWAGLSVTMPNKAAAAAVAVHRSARVDLLGVANTLTRGVDGWQAENTDVDGVLGALRAAGLRPCRSVLILGGGGTALAVVAALSEWNPMVRLVFAGRRPGSTSGAVDLARRLGIGAEVVGFSADDLAEAAGTVELTVSTVPAGGADHLATVLAQVPALLDVVYHPWPTPLAAAGMSDRITVTGLDLLLHQALRQFELFTGIPAPAAAMRDGLRAAAGSDLALPL